MCRSRGCDASAGRRHEFTIEGGALISSPPYYPERRIADIHRDDIETASQYYGVPALSVAAAVEWQGSASVQRRLMGLEGAQYDGLLPGMKTGMKASLGIGQMSAEEIEQYVSVSCRKDCVLDDRMQLLGMAGKLAGADELLPTDIDPTDRMMVLAIAQDEGPGAAKAYMDYRGDWVKIFANVSHAYDQNRHIVDQIRWLVLGGYSLPEGVDFDLWVYRLEHGGQNPPDQP